MSEEKLYPQNIEDLFSKIEFIIENEQNQEKIFSLLNWIDWYKSQNYNFKYVCNDNEFLKAFYDDDKYSLQIWEHNLQVDSIKFNLLSNHFSEYDNELTQINM